MFNNSLIRPVEMLPQYIPQPSHSAVYQFGIYENTGIYAVHIIFLLRILAASLVFYFSTLLLFPYQQHVIYPMLSGLFSP